MFNEIKSFQNLKQKFKKDNFAEKCKKLDPEEFKGFEALFDLILEIKNNKPWYQNLTKLCSLSWRPSQTKKNILSHKW